MEIVDLLDDLVDARRGPLDLAGLVGHDVVVVVLAGQFDGGVALAQFELVDGLGRARLQPGEQGLHRWRDHEDQERVGDPFLDLLGALDIDLEDDVVPGRERLLDLGTRRPVPVAVDLVGLQQTAGVAQGEEVLDDP